MTEIDTPTTPGAAGADAPSGADASRSEAQPRRRRRGPMRARLVVLLAVVAAAAVAVALLSGGKSARGGSSSGNVWKTRVDTGAALDPRSTALVAELGRQVSEAGVFINTWQFSSPVYTVPARQPTVRVALDTTAPDLQAAFDAVPIPPDARAAAGADQNMVVRQPAKDTMWEFWRLHKVGADWHARWGGKMTRVSQNPGYFTAPHANWGASASSLTVLGGLVRIAEFKAHRIDHALALAIPQPRARYYTAPAQRTDGTLASPAAIPEGTRFRLDPSLDLDKLHLTPFVKTLAQAAQRYGIIVRDRAGTVSFFGEDPGRPTVDPYPAIYGPQKASDQLKTFPWDRLQALKGHVRCCWPPR